MSKDIGQHTDGLEMEVKGRRMVDDDRFSVEQVLEIGRRFQQEDKWHGAHYDTVKLLCDTIEKLYAEVQKCHMDIHLQDEEYNEE